MKITTPQITTLQTTTPQTAPNHPTVITLTLAAAGSITVVVKKFVIIPKNLVTNLKLVTIVKNQSLCSIGGWGWGVGGTGPGAQADLLTCATPPPHP